MRLSRHRPYWTQAVVYTNEVDATLRTAVTYNKQPDELNQYERIKEFHRFIDEAEAADKAEDAASKAQDAKTKHPVVADLDDNEIVGGDDDDLKVTKAAGAGGGNYRVTTRWEPSHRRRLPTSTSSASPLSGLSRRM